MEKIQEILNKGLGEYEKKHKIVGYKQKVINAIKDCKTGDRGTGLVVKAPKPELVAEGIVRYFSDESIRTSCIGNIQKEKERLSWHKFCEDLLDFSKNL